MDHEHSEHPGVTWPDPDDEVGADVADEPGPGPGGWASWLVVGVAALPPLVLAEVARRFLGGGEDSRWFGGSYAGLGTDTVVDLDVSARFSLFWSTVPVLDVLPATLVAVLALCAVVVAGRPGWLVPTRWGRRVGAGAAALTAVESLLALVALLGRDPDPLSQTLGGLQLSYDVPSTGNFPELVPVLTMFVVTAVLPGVAAVVLWRADDPAPAVGGAETPVVPEVVEEPPSEAEPPVVPPVAEPPAVPKLSPEELDAYRRPRA